MVKVPFRSVLFSLIALVAIGGLIVSNKPPSKIGGAPDFKTGACKESGTTVVIDFGDESTEPALVNCVHQAKAEATGWQLLKAAGLVIEGTSEYPEAFVCRINNVPNIAREDCLGTPSPLNGTWIYFYSTLGKERKNSWAKSPVGAATRKPQCGDYEGWLFAKSTSAQNSLSQVPEPAPNPFVCK